MQDKGSKFNWKLPLFGAVGFGGGSIIASIITYIIISYIITKTTSWVWAEILVAIGPICGAALGGAALGLALKDKKKTIYLACAAPLGIVIGFIITVVPFFIIMIVGYFEADSPGGGSATMQFIITVALYIVLLLYGAIFGGAIGIVFKNAKKTIYLALVGAIGFAIGSAIVYFIDAAYLYTVVSKFTDATVSDWMSPSPIGQDIVGVIIIVIAAAIVGALLGYALAHLTREEDFVVR